MPGPTASPPPERLLNERMTEDRRIWCPHAGARLSPESIAEGRRMIALHGKGPRESLPIYVEKLPDVTIRRDYFDEWLASEEVEGEIAVPYLGVELDDGVVLYKVRRMRILFERHRKRKPTPERKAKPTRKRPVAGERS